MSRVVLKDRHGGSAITELGNQAIGSQSLELRVGLQQPARLVAGCGEGRQVEVDGLASARGTFAGRCCYCFG